MKTAKFLNSNQTRAHAGFFRFRFFIRSHRPTAVYSAAIAVAAEYIDGSDKLNNEKNALLAPDVYDICHFRCDRDEERGIFIHGYTLIRVA